MRHLPSQCKWRLTRPFQFLRFLGILKLSFSARLSIRIPSQYWIPKSGHYGQFPENYSKGFILSVRGSKALETVPGELTIGVTYQREIEHWTRFLTKPHRPVQRARIILALKEERSLVQVAYDVGATRKTVIT